MKFLKLLLLLALCSSISATTNWPQFRGSDSRGIGQGENLPDTWSSTENVAWATDLPGRGWSSPIVWGDRVFLTTVVNSGISEEPPKGLYFGGNRPEAPGTVHNWIVYCLDLNSGKINWQHTVKKAKPETGIHIKSSYASETPVTDGEHVYFYFGNVGLFVYDMKGKHKWTKNFESRFTRHGWGTAASPFLYKDQIYIINDNEEESWLLALDKHTGKEFWRTDREQESNWSSPYVWENNIRTEIIIPATKKVRSYNLAGKELWSFEGMSSITIATPYEADGLLYISSGYVGSRNKPIYAIRSGANGDISVDETNNFNEFIIWSDWHAAPYNPSTLVYQDNLYVLWDRGLLSIMDPKTGEIHLEKERIPRDSGGFTSSPWAYDGKVFCLSEDGDTFVFKAGRTFDLLHVNRLAEDDMCMATPAITGKKLLIRTAARLYCFEN